MRKLKKNLVYFFKYACILLILNGCASQPDTVLGSVGIAQMQSSSQLIIQTDVSSGFSEPVGSPVSGAGEGAAAGMANYVSGLEGQGATLGIILAPIMLPVFGTAGAALAHPEEEVQRALANFKKIGEDKALIGSLDARIVNEVHEKDGVKWSCITTPRIPTDTECVTDSTPEVLYIRPLFRLTLIGDFDPDVTLTGEVLARSSRVMGESHEVRWAYKKEIGSFFSLAEKDAAKLRVEVDAALDRFAEKIAEDLFLHPQQQRVRKERINPFMPAQTAIPDGVVMRIEQGDDLVSGVTHGRIILQAYSGKCAITAVDDEPTGHLVDRKNPISLPLRSGQHVLRTDCVRNPGSTNQTSETLELEVLVHPGETYFTDGKSYWR